mmetsp:Transcript_1662/g.3612  ORF Transcript_1662/g.3612 Transcript_1662/m.3612 type:complete len:286 (-) Transcript_1662:560-1417(-)
MRVHVRISKKPTDCPSSLGGSPSHGLHEQLHRCQLHAGALLVAVQPHVGLLQRRSDLSQQLGFLGCVDRCPRHLGGRHPFTDAVPALQASNVLPVAVCRPPEELEDFVESEGDERHGGGGVKQIDVEQTLLQHQVTFTLGCPADSVANVVLVAALVRQRHPLVREKLLQRRLCERENLDSAASIGVFRAAGCLTSGAILLSLTRSRRKQGVAEAVGRRDVNRQVETRVGRVIGHLGTQEDLVVENHHSAELARAGPLKGALQQPRQCWDEPRVAQERVRRQLPAR